MVRDAWLPRGFVLPSGAKAQLALFEGADWQILGTDGDDRVLVVRDALFQKWRAAGFVETSSFQSFAYGSDRLWIIAAGKGQVLSPVAEGKSPDTKDDALAFALALKATRAIDAETPLQDALYVEKISRLLPTYTISTRMGDDVVLGYWLTGGASISAKSFRRLRQTLSWLGPDHLKEIVESAGFEVTEVVPTRRSASSPLQKEAAKQPETVTDNPAPEQKQFQLAGRPELAAFVNEHIVDIVQNRERYQALGISFPSAVVLHGPPGCGKTFAVDRLIDFLGWPSFQIDASSVASPYIHETSKKVAEVFDKAMQNAPSVLVIDEMEAFLADREMGSGHHRVEEVAEFLRRIPEAAKNDVLIVAMTNRVDMIDPAILRRGRFDHVINVDFANAAEVLALLEHLLSSLPKDGDVHPSAFATELAGRPLSDVTFVVREGARLAARSGKSKLDQASLLAALRAAPARGREGETERRIGFI